MATFEQTNLTAFLNRLSSNSLTPGDQALIAQALNFCITNWGNLGISVDPNTGVGTDPAPVDDEWFAVLYNEALGFGGGSGLIPTSWTQPTWFIDPVNGNDSNNGFLAISALKTWARLVALWGTTSPILRQTTTITFLSSHVDNTDPVIFKPYLGAGASAILQGTAPTVVTAGVVLAGTTPKNTAVGTNSLLITTLGATGAVGQLLQNTTAGKISRAWVYKALGGNSFSISQPCVPLAPPGPLAVTEMNTWANGDTVNLLQPVSVNVAEVDAVVLDSNNPTFTNGLYVFQLVAFDPSGVGNDNVIYGRNVHVYECFEQRIACYERFNLASTGQVGRLNVFSSGAAQVQGDALMNGPRILAGVSGIGTWLCLPAFGSDCILNQTTLVQGGSFVGSVFLDGNVTVQDGALIIVGAATVVYGSGVNTINAQNQTKVAQLTGNTFVATFTAPGLVTGIKLNGTATGSSHTGASPDVLNSAITTTPAHLDAAAGVAGFGGNAFNLGGASCANVN